MTILVCGGAGYIGSHMAKMLTRAGYRVVVFDNLSTGHREAVKWGEFVEGDLLDQGSLERLFISRGIDAVMHFSARSVVSESVANPELYYRNNLLGTCNLLTEMRKAGVEKLVFSSTAATFGNPHSDRIDESHPQEPLTPYGRSKLMIEQLLKDFALAYGLRSVSLRYFNAAGADSEGELGERHDPETHLIPNVLRAALGNSRLEVFGQDYGTLDGTCVRDFIHVEDLCRAHLLALQYLADHPGAHGFNLGTGQGFSVLQVIHAASQVVGSNIPFVFAKRREGDPAVLVADSSRARDVLGWKPLFVDIQELIQSAWNWQRKQ